MHLLGQRIWTDVVAPDGTSRWNNYTNDRILTTENSYNFAMQNTDPIENATFTPADTFTTKCIYLNSVDYGRAVGNAEAAAGQTVHGGETTYEEMCMTFSYYYPRIIDGDFSGQLLQLGSSFCGDGVNANCSEFH